MVMCCELWITSVAYRWQNCSRPALPVVGELPAGVLHKVSASQSIPADTSAALYVLTANLQKGLPYSLVAVTALEVSANTRQGACMSNV